MKKAFVILLLSGFVGVVLELNSEASALFAYDLSKKDTELLSTTYRISCGGGGGGSQRTPEERKKARLEMKTLFEANQREKAKLLMQKQKNGIELTRREKKILSKFGNQSSFN